MSEDKTMFVISNEFTGFNMNLVKSVYTKPSKMGGILLVFVGQNGEIYDIGAKDKEDARNYFDYIFSHYGRGENVCWLPSESKDGRTIFPEK